MISRVRVERLVALSVLILAVFLSSSCWASVPDWMMREGSVGWALSLRDGSHIYLYAVIIDKIRAHTPEPYFTIRECFYASDRLFILSPPSTLLRMGQLIDVEGDLITLPNGDRGLQNVTVWGYTSEDGTLLIHGGPLCKGILGPTEWDYKIDLTVRSFPATAVTEPASPDEPNTDSAERPSYYQSISDIVDDGNTQTQSLRTQSYYDGIPEVRGLPDGSLVELQCKRIIGVGTETIDSIEYNYLDIAEDLPATDWIRAYYSGTVAVTDRVNKVTGQIRHTDPETPVIDIDTGPGGYDPQILEGQLQTAAQGSLAWAKTFNNGTTLPVDLVDKVVSRAYPSAGYFYIQEPMRGSGIRVYNQAAAQSVQPGTTVTISGTISSWDGERLLTPSSVTITGYTDEPGSLGMNNRALGGGDFNVYTPGIIGSSEMPNVGLLVRIWGRVTSVDPDTDPRYFYLDDGSNVDNGEGSPRGVKVSWEWQGSQDGNLPIAAPEEGWLVAVTGISSSEISGSETVRVLRLRRQEDMQVLLPEDDAGPYVNMITPADGEIHKAPDQSTAQLAGTATDVDTGIASVQVGFTATGVETPPSTWYAASYNPTTSAWTYDWQNPQTQRIWVKATDFAMRTATTSKDVTVFTVTAVKYVRPGGACTKDGSSWDNAEDKVGDAINAATSGTEVWVAKGTYVERITLKSGVALYGGFVGGTTTGETYREQRAWRENVTTLDGNYGGNVVTSPYGITATTILDGFVICHGSSSGVSCSNSSPIISNNTIITNTATYGGGINCSQTYGGSCVPTIVNNIVTGNSATNGGGIYCDSASPKIISNVIAGNRASEGGAVYTRYGSPKIWNNTITHNGASTQYNSAICVSSNSYTSIINNIVAFNSGGIRKDGGSPTLRNNCIYSNGGYDYIALQPGTGDFSENPYLADAAYRNMHIQPNSRCIGAGDSSIVEAGWLDIDGQSRPPGQPVDIGADESDGTTWATSVPVVIYVSPNGDDALNDGLSWAQAKRTVQAGIDAAVLTGGDVWIESAVYNEHVTLSPYVHLFGGFAGSEVSRSDRNWLEYPTILDGQGNGNVVTVKTGTCTVDGFVVRCGYPWGITCEYSSPTIRHNIISDITVTSTGGGIYSNCSSPTINNNVITNIKGYGISGASSICTISNNTITDCSNYGISTTFSPNSVISNNIVAFNKTYGIYTNGQLRNNCIYGNPSGNYGSGTQPGIGDISLDPKFCDLQISNLHIQPNSPCLDAGWDNAPGNDDTDIDGDTRMIDLSGIGTAIVDIGVDESDGSGWYYLTLTANPDRGPVGEPIVVTANVKDWNDNNVPGHVIYFSITDGTITSITDGTVDTPTTGHGNADENGNVSVLVSRAADGKATVSASVYRPFGTGSVNKTCDIWFFDTTPDDWPM